MKRKGVHIGKMKDKEIERRFKLTQEQKENILNFVKNQASFKGKCRQFDVYYEPNFKEWEKDGKTMEALRIRTVDAKSTMNYKYIHREANPIYNDEYESAIENSEQMEKILFAIGFHRLIEIDKTRQTYLYEDYEFDIESVVGLGDFLEVELKGENADVSKIFELVKLFGLTDRDVTFDGIIKLMQNANKKSL